MPRPSKSQLRKIMNRAATLRSRGAKPGPALKRAWADFREGKL